VKLVVAIVAQGTMGTGLARRLVEHGVEVFTTLAGRSSASQSRAAAAGMTAVPLARLTEADFLLSILPPATALPFAMDLAPLLRSAARKPLFVDCNAVSPATLRSIADVVNGAGAGFVDVGIIGLPPKPGYSGPHLYAAGESAAQLSCLCDYGLDVRVLDGPIGTASALKMSYAGITKGITAVATTMVLAATRAGLARALERELAESEPALLASLARRLPDMVPKAYRWVAEMQQIRQFAAEDGAAAGIFTGAAQLYERIALDASTERRETTALEKFFDDREPP
jgi:L-threonate 2-dehydrogenase